MVEVLIKSATSLTHSFPVHLFSTPGKHHKTLLFLDVFKRYRKGALGRNGLIYIFLACISSANIMKMHEAKLFLNFLDCHKCYNEDPNLFH